MAGERLQTRDKGWMGTLDIPMPPPSLYCDLLLVEKESGILERLLENVQMLRSH
ncbi:unnamed protein product [Sphenostylis stenocarpa]|uniref:Uncharacterized protein n=1 Tax=Sphenostylis stenocarpa TaxID=92480 RepID=A0AA86V2Y5_9FABA|nr:unnamed protein product [Sphenostylis stenocarpa]